MSPVGDRSTRAPLVIVGGYGLVGAQAARMLRRRQPDLPLVLAGRHPERARGLALSLGASTATVDVRATRPLDSLPERPAAVLAAVTDPDDALLLDAMRRGIPIADINRAGPASVLDVAVCAARERPAAPVLLSGSWLAGVSALMAAAAVRELGRPERVDIAILVSSDDRVGPDAWGFGARLPWPYYPMVDGRRRPVQPLSGLRHVRCADERERPAALVGTLEQVTLPITLGVPTVETRMALADPPMLFGLVGLKRSGALRALARPALQRVRAALLQRPGTGDIAGLTVTAERRTRSVAIDVLDVQGQSHLSAVGAVRAAERVLGIAGPPLPAGIAFPEQHADPSSDLAALRQAGATVRLHGFREPAERPPEHPREPEPAEPLLPVDVPREEVTA